MICPGCEKEICEGEDKFLHVNDHPYVNIYWHRKCFFESTDEEKAFILGEAEVIRWTT